MAGLLWGLAEALESRASSSSARLVPQMLCSPVPRKGWDELVPLALRGSQCSLSTVITDHGRGREDVEEVVGTLLCVQRYNKYLC